MSHDRVTGQHDHWEIGLVFSPFLAKKVKFLNSKLVLVLLIQQHAIKELIRLKLVDSTARERKNQTEYSPFRFVQIQYIYS